MKTIIFLLNIILFFFSIIPAAATDPGSLEKATVQVHSITYSTATQYNALTLSGDGKVVALAKAGPAGRVVVADVDGTGETVLTNGEYGIKATMALNSDGSSLVVECLGSEGPGYLYINTVTPSITYIAIGNYLNGHPCIDFNLSYYTEIYYSFLPVSTSKQYYLNRYALESGTLLESIDLGVDIWEPQTIYYLYDDRYCYTRNGASGEGIYYLPSGATDLSSEVLVQSGSTTSEKWEASTENPQIVAISSDGCDTLNYYQPVDSAARTLFVDDSGFSLTADRCTVRWMEMGLESGYTFSSDGALHMVQAYGSIPYQTGRYFTAQDLGYSSDYFIYDANHGLGDQRNKTVSSDGTRILLKVGKRYYYQSDSDITFLVAEVTGTETETTTTTTSSDTTTTTTVSGDTSTTTSVSVDTTSTTSVTDVDTTTTTTTSEGNTGELGGPCYGNGTCNTGLVCIDYICQEAEEGTLGGPCYGNGTCNAGLECVNDVCIEATDNCSATYVLGEDDPRLETVRRFRDEVLSNSVFGESIIEVYQRNTREMIAAMEKYPVLKKIAGKVLESLIPAMKLLLKE